jgi:NifU-like protein involved in Fe-S cluster formation
MTPNSLLAAVVLLTVAAAGWLVLHRYLNPRIKHPDGYAKFTGSCGDTMEIELKFKDQKVEDYYCWTDGCSISKMCLATAAMLARGKTVPELRTIDRTAILKEVGHLPDTHMHCAVLAEIVLQMAVENYAAVVKPAQNDHQAA